MSLENKINIVKKCLKNKKVAIGFSGGADSTLISYLSSKVAEDTLAITIDNHLMPTGFIEHAQNQAKSFNIKHEIIDIDFYKNEEFLKNTQSRCYTCRDLMYSQIKKFAAKKGFDYVCDGNNISDLVIDRPGILITYSQGFNTPLIEAKLTSKEIHEYLNKNKIPFSKSTTCLATRIPTNTKTTREKIEKISYCEDYILANTECEIVKFRDNDKIGIIEVDNVSEILADDKYIKINDELKRQGYENIALNLSQIEDDDHIILDFHDGSFSYQLPFTLNIEKTKKQLQNNIISANHEKIQIENIDIYENGFIKGHDFENYENALNNFLETLPKLRRTI